MVKIVIFASGSGSNFENLVEASRDENLGYEVKLLIVDKEKAFALERAEKLNIPALYINPKLFQTKSDMEKYIIPILEDYCIDCIILAGYMRILSEPLLNAYLNKIINIHPAYLPEFPGKDGIGEAFRSGAKETGVTIHYVDAGIDTGQIITQKRLKIDPNWNLENLTEEIRRLEHRLYPQVLKNLFWRKI